MNILTRVLQRKSKTFHVRGVYLIAYKSVNIYDVPGVLEEMEMKLYLNVHQKKEGRLKMYKVSMSDNVLFEPVSCNGCDFRKGDLESMCKAYLCFSERTLDCLVFKVVKEKFKRNVTEF